MSAENEVVAAAHAWLGTPYRHQSAQRGVGCDCLGLLLGVYREQKGGLEINLPPYSRDWRDASYSDELSAIAERYLKRDDTIELSAGRVLLFEMRRGAAAKHCGIMVQNHQFIHAQERIGVVKAHLSPWWQRRVIATYQFG